MYLFFENYSLHQHSHLIMSEKLIIVHEGTKFYFTNKKLHRDNDEPAVIHQDGTREYWYNGKRHRIDGPAIFNPNTSWGVSILNGKVKPVVDIWSLETASFVRTVLDPKDIIEAITRIEPILESLEDVEDDIMIDQTDMKVNYFYKGMLHRCPCFSSRKDTYPAEITNFGSEIYYRYGVKHRDDGPAVFDNVTKKTMWYNFGMIHREDGPAVISYTNDQLFCENSWYKNGLMENEDGPAYIKFNCTTREIVARNYYKQGQLHREGGPAMIMTLIGSLEECKWWYQYGKFHNLRGPSYEGEMTCWAINGVMYSEEEYNNIIKNVYKFIYKLRRNYRKKASNVIYKNTNICKDVSDIVSSFLF